MNTWQILSKHNIAGYVVDIFVFENSDAEKKTTLPFFADGFPGIMFLQSENGARLTPYNKPLSDFFLYGQTIKPIEIIIDGPFRFIAFQLCPFATKALFNLHPKSLKDDCFDLLSGNYPAAQETAIKLSNTIVLIEQIEIIAQYLSTLVDYSLCDKGAKIEAALQLIIKQKGIITVKSISENLHMTERTLQRQFEEYVGLSPKQFAKIIQFNSSRDQIASDSFSTFSDVVYANGYADQSHFIRNFKFFTGKKPSQFITGQS